MSRHSALVLSILLRFVSKFGNAILFILVPFVGQTLLVSTQDIQRLIPLFLVGSSFSQFFVGSLADVFGKRRTLLTLLSLLSLGSLLCAGAQEMWMMQAGIFLTALGIGAIAGIGNTLIFDGYRSSQRASRALAFSSVLVIWAPALAMNLGSVVAQWDWRHVFVCQAVAALVLGYLTWQQVPTSQTAQVSPLAKLGQSATGYLSLLRCQSYRIVATRMCLLGGGIVAFYTIGLPQLQAEFGPTHLTVFFAPVLVVGANCLGRLLAGFLPERIPQHRIDAVGSFLCLLSGLAILMAAGCGFRTDVCLAPMALYVLGIGLIFSAQRIQLLSFAQDRPVTSESTLGILMALSGALISWLATIANSVLTAPGALGLLLIGLVGWTFLHPWLVQKPEGIGPNRSFFSGEASQA